MYRGKAGEGYVRGAWGPVLHCTRGGGGGGGRGVGRVEEGLWMDWARAPEGLMTVPEEVASCSSAVILEKTNRTSRS